MSPLDEALRTAALRSPLLVVCDYDGVLAPLVDDPDEAYPDESAMAAVVALAVLPDVNVALLSGRKLADLRRLSGEPADIMLLGSHGAEAADDPVLSPSKLELRNTIAREMERIADRFPGSLVEVKPGGVAFHYRKVPGPLQGDAARLALAGPGSRTGLKVIEGKNIVEVSLVAGDKGTAIDRLRRLTDASATVFLGDDATDEDGFARLGTNDVGIKVGPEPTRAAHRIDEQSDVAEILARLVNLRTAATER